MEKLPVPYKPEPLRVPHEDVECLIALNGIARTFSTADTACWIYPKRYKMFNHIVQWHEDGTWNYWFGCDDDDFDTLHEAGITQICPPYPTDDLQDHFWAIEMADYERELGLLKENGEIPEGF